MWIVARAAVQSDAAVVVGKLNAGLPEIVVEIGHVFTYKLFGTIYAYAFGKVHREAHLINRDEDDVGLVRGIGGVVFSMEFSFRY